MVSLFCDIQRPKKGLDSISSDKSLALVYKMSILSIGRNFGEDEEARPEVTQNSGEEGLGALVVMSCSNCLCQFRKLVAILPTNRVVAIFPNLNIFHNCLKHVRTSNCSFEQFCSNFALQIPLFPEHRD